MIIAFASAFLIGTTAYSLFTTLYYLSNKLHTNVIVFTGEFVATHDHAQNLDGLFVTMLEGDADLCTAFEFVLTDEGDAAFGKVASNCFADLAAIEHIDLNGVGEDRTCVGSHG